MPVLLDLLLLWLEIKRKHLIVSLYDCLYSDFGEQSKTCLRGCRYWKSCYDVPEIIYLHQCKYLMWEHLNGLKLYFRYISLTW